jgi:hypothetical protein
VGEARRPAQGEGTTLDDTRDQSHDEPIEVFTLHSHKGGVGKTSLAIAIATLSALRGRSEVLLLDADLTGSCVSFALGEKLGHVKPGTPCLNDVLLANPDDFLDLSPYARCGKAEGDTDPGAWAPYIRTRKIDEGASFDYVPSSPHLKDIRRIVPTIAQEHTLHFYGNRLHDVLLSLVRRRYRTVIVDLPPGMSGLSEAAFRAVGEESLASDLQDAGMQRLPPCICRRIVVTTTEPTDYLTALPILWDLERSSEADQRGQTRETDLHRRPLVWFNKALPRAGEDRLDSVLALGGTFKELGEYVEALASQATSGDESRVQYFRDAHAHYDSACRDCVLPFVVDPPLTLGAVVSAAVRLRNLRDQGRPPFLREDGAAHWVGEVRKALGWDKPEEHGGTDAAL